MIIINVTLLIISSKPLTFSLKVSDSSLIVSLTPRKIAWSCWNEFLSSIFGTGLLGVIAIVLFFSSVVCVIGLAKLSVAGSEGSGAILGSLFLNGDKLPSEKKKLVSRGLVGSRKCGGGGKSFSSSSNSLLLDLWGGVWGCVSGKLKFMLDFLFLIIRLGMLESSLSVSWICLFWNLSWFCQAIIPEF